MDNEIKSPGRILADEMYAEPEVVQQPVSDSEDVKPEEPVIDPEKVEEPTAEQEDDELEITSLSQLAEHLETEPDWLNGLKTTQKVNGQDVEFSISDAIETHMKVEAADDYLSSAKTQAKAIIEDASNQKESIAATGAVFSELVKELEAEIGKDEIDLAKLRKDDPAEHAARKLEYKERQERLEAIKQKAIDSVKAVADTTASQQIEEMKADLPNQQKILLERIPEWSDVEKAQEEQPKVFQYLSDEGYGAEDIKVASYNGRLMSLAIKAMRYDESKQKSNAAKKKVTKIPKMLKPGTKKDESNTSSDATDRVALLYG